MLSRALQGMPTYGKSSKARIADVIAWMFGHSMTPIAGPGCWCLQRMFNKLLKKWFEKGENIY